MSAVPTYLLPVDPRESSVRAWMLSAGLVWEINHSLHRIPRPDVMAKSLLWMRDDGKLVETNYPPTGGES